VFVAVMRVMNSLVSAVLKANRAPSALVFSTLM
jgi:hypothetical protein